MKTLPEKETQLLTDILEQLQEVANFVSDDQLETAVSNLSEFVSVYGTEKINKQGGE
jgi:hypothetical protein